MHLYGGLPSPVALLILLLFSLYVGLYHALFGWVIGLLRGRLYRAVALAIAPFAWVAVELARARVTGFPWDLLGYTQVDNLTISRLAPWTGVMGISLLVAAVNAAWLVRSRRVRYLGVALGGVTTVVFFALAARGASYPKSSTDASATLLQENLGVGVEAGPRSETPEAMMASFDWLSTHPQGTASYPIALIVWPEAPADFFDQNASFRAQMGALAKSSHAAVIVDDLAPASVDASHHTLWYNSGSFYASDGSYAGRYDKMHLVPFGEYTPYKQLFFFAGHLVDDLPFVPGARRTLFVTPQSKYGVFICYESIFGDEIREFSDFGAQVLVNVSDDGWYGDSSAPWEHLDMVRMRAIENDRWVLRSTNTGVTAAIDPLGRMVATLPRHVRSAIAVNFGQNSDVTFYARHGDWLGWLCACGTAAAVAAGFARRRKVH